MAEYDGAVRVNTAFDAGGFDKGVDRMVKAMHSLTGSVEKLGKTIDKAFSGYAQSLQGAGAATKQVETALDGAADKTERVSAAADKTAESYGKVAQEAGKAKAALSDVDGAAKGSFSKYEEAYGNAAEKIEELRRGLISLELLNSGGTVDERVSFVQNIETVEQELLKLYDVIDQFQGTEQFKEFNAQAAEIEATLNQVRADFEKLDSKPISVRAEFPIVKDIENLINGFSRFEEAAPNTVSMFRDNGEALKRQAAEAEEYAQKLQNLRAQLTEMYNSEKLISEDSAVSEGLFRRMTSDLYESEQKARELQATFQEAAKNVPGGEWSESFNQISAQIQSAEAAFDKFQAKVDKMATIGAGDKAWASVEYDIGLAADEAERLQEELDALSESGDIDETQYDELSARIADLIGDYDDLQDAVSQSTQDAMPQYLEDWEQMPTLSGMVSDGFERIRNSALTALTAVQHPIQALDRGLALVAQTAIRAGDALLRMVRWAIINGLRLIGESAAEAARNITKMTATAVSGGIKRLGAWLSNAAKSMTLFGRSTKRNSNVLKKSLTTILKYGLGVRSFYFLFRKVRQAVAEGYKNLVRYSDALNTSISGVISSFKRFENQFAASFEPLVNTIAPALANLINSLTEGTYRVGEFIAALSGQKTVIRAKEAQEDYAESLDKTKKAAKEAERQLAGFDQLNILKKPDEEETNPEDMFETVPVGDGAKNLADTVKDAWVNVDLTGLGEIVGGKIKVALDKIPWPDIKKGAKDLGRRLATFLNGIINVPDFGKSLGKTLAEAINTAFAFLDGFAWNFDWKGLGNAIMDTVEAACDTLNWELINHALQGLALGLANLLNTIFSRKEVWEKIGHTIGKAINAAVNAGITFLERFDFKQAASAIVAGLNAMIDEIEWDKIGRLLADAFGGALQFLYTAITEFHWADFGADIAEMVNEFVAVMLERIEGIEWSEIGAKIAEGVNHAVSGIHWDELGTLIGQLLGGALSAVATFIRDLNYDEIVQAIQDFFSNAIQQIDFYDLLTVWGVATLIVAVKKIIAKHPVLALLAGAVLALGPELGNAIHKMVSDIPWEELGANFAGALNGIISRIDEAITSVDWAGETAAIMVGLNSFLAGIDWASLGQTLTDAVMAFLAVINTALYDFDWKGLGADIAVLIQNIDVVEILKGAAWFVSNLVTGLLDLINGFLEAADWTELPGTILNGFLGVVTSVEWGRIAGQIIELLLNAILVVVQLAWGIGEAIAEWILSGIEAAKNYFQEAGENVTNGILAGLGKIWDGIKGWIKEHIFQPFISAWEHIWQIGSPSKVMEEQGGFIVSGLFNGIVAAWHIITDFFGDALDGLITTLSGAWETIKTGASGKLSEVAKTVSEKWNDMKTTASTAWDGLKKTVGNTISGVKQSAIGKVSEIVNETKTKWDRIKSDALSGWSNVKSAIVPKAQEIRSGVVSAFQSMQGMLSGVWNGIRSAASGALASVSATVSSMASSISSRVSSIRSAVSNITSSASDALSKVADKMDDLTKKSANNVIKVGGLASGGFVTDGGHIRSWYDSVRKYASGTLRAAGSLFVAGEAGPEIVGHVNGQTEVLNQSQIAGAIYSAVLAAMSEAVKTFGGFLSQQMASNTNALIAAIGQIQTPAQIVAPQDTAMLERLAALQAVPYQVPAYATGTVMPYEAVAEIRRQTSELKTAIYDNGQIVISAVVSAISNHGLAVTDAIRNIPVNQGQSLAPEQITRYAIEGINRQKIMMGKSPLYS